MVARLPCLVASTSSPCAWSPHAMKHFPHQGMQREHTRRGPAKYLAAFTRDRIQALEAETVRHGERGLPLGHTATYIRGVGEVIGWDEGLDATLSFVECSGGETSGRTYHRPPMRQQNPTLTA